MTRIEELEFSRDHFQGRYLSINASYPLRLRVLASGDARYAAHANAAGREPEIGLYHHVFSHERLAEFEGLVTTLLIDGPAEPPTPVAGFGLVQLRIRGRGRERSLQFVPVVERDPLLQWVVAGADTLVRELLPHPEWTVRADISELRREGPVVLATLRLSNRGSVPIGVRTPPAALTPESGAAFAIAFVERGNDPAARARAATLESVALVSPASHGQRTLELRPAEPAEMRLRVRLPSERGGSLRIYYNNRKSSLRPVCTRAPARETHARTTTRRGSRRTRGAASGRRHAAARALSRAGTASDRRR